MSRGYQPEQQLDPRVSSEGREPNGGDPPKPEEVREQAPNDASKSPGREPDRPGARTAEARTVYDLRGRTYRLRNSEIVTMVELGKFRAAATENLAEFVYSGNNNRMRPDVENLVRQGLVEMKSVPHEETGSRQLLTLTKNGHRFLTQTQSAGKGQALYHGFTKPVEFCCTSRGLPRALPTLKVFLPPLHCAASHRISPRRRSLPRERQAATRIRCIRRNPSLLRDSPEVGKARIRCAGNDGF
jgi:hypothetical protein